jgi:hypothetical protein
MFGDLAVTLHGGSEDATFSGTVASAVDGNTKGKKEIITMLIVMDMLRFFKLLTSLSWENGICEASADISIVARDRSLGWFLECRRPCGDGEHSPLRIQAVLADSASLSNII